MNNFAHLKPECPFYDLFPRGLVPIINIIVPSHAKLEGCDETEVYMVNLDRLSQEQITEIAARMAAKAGVSPLRVFNEIKAQGLPLRVSQTTGVSTDAPFFL